MAKFLENTASVKREAGRTKKKKKQETTQKKVQSPSVSQRAQETNQRLTQKYGGGSTRTSSSSQRNNQTQQNLPNRRYQNTMESRNPRMLDSPTNQRRYVAPETTNGGSQGRRNQQYLEEDRKRRQRESEERRQAAQRQKMGMNSMVSTEGQEAANRAVRNTPTVLKESAKQVAIGHGKTLADVTEQNKSAAIGSKIDIKSKEFQEDIEKRRKKSTEKSREAFNALSGMQERSEEAMNSKTANAKGFEKAYYGALESGTGMLADRALGPAWAVSMFSRTYGNTRGKAQKEGATESEDRANALLQAAKETATEYMFRGAGLAKGLSGKWSLAPAEKLANLATRNMKGPMADAVHAGIRLLGGVGEENLEEAAAWGVEPLIEEYTYKRNVRARKAQATKDMLRDQSDSLRSNIQSPEQAEAVASYLNSPEFIESNMQTYKDTGMSDKDARELAESMRDYLTATMSGDTDTMESIEDELSKKFAGKGLSKEDWSFSELMDTFAATTLLTGATGLPGTATTAMRGSAIRDQLGDQGVRALADTAIDFEDKQDSLKAQAMSDRMNSGKEITSTQAYDLMQAAQKQYAKDSNRQDAAYMTARRTIDSERLVTPFQQERDGSISLDEVTAKNYQSSERSAREAINAALENDEQASLTDTKIDRGSQAIAGFQTGVFTVDDANELNFRNTAVRDAFKAETGIDLSQYIVKGKDGEVDIPATNTKTKEALFALAADNLVKSAQAETANWMDNVKGEVVTQISQRMGSKGMIALQQALDDVDERDRAKYMTTANATDMLYHAGREMGTSWENVKGYATRMYKGISEEKLKAMYDAGLADRDMASDKARGAQTVIGEAIAETSQESAPLGQLVVETETPVKGTVARVFSELADNLGVDIHLVDKFVDKDGKVLKNVNGEYRDGAIYINVNSSFEQNVGYIFMHEVTHHLKMFAPEQFNQLEELVREKWFKYDASQMQSEIAKKIELYAAHGQTLTEEQALEEIIADAAHEFINDPNFAQQVAEENPSLAKAMLNSIRNALRMLRRVLATGSIEDETHMNTLFSQLGILDEAERLWLNAYTQAVANRAAVGIEDLQNRIYEEGRLSVATDAKAIQKATDRAAKEAGFTIKGYHGTTNKFNAFKAGDIGIHFGKNKGTARTRVGKGKNTRIIPAWLSLHNPIKMDVDLGSWDADYRLADYLRDEGIISSEEHQDVLTFDDYGRRKKRSTKNANDALRTILKSKGYDGIEYKNYYEADGAISYIVFDSNQIKSADPITYDDNGNTIPLSERFNTETPDIRYSISETDSDGNTLSDAQREYFKDSKVVDENGNLRVMYHGTFADDFYVFEPKDFLEEQNGMSKIKGYFSTSEDYSRVYGHTKSFYLNIKNPLFIPDEGKTLDEWKSWFASYGIDNIEFDSSITEDSSKGVNYGEDENTYYALWDLFDAGDLWNGDGNLTERIETAGYDGVYWHEGEGWNIGDGKFVEGNPLAYMPFHENAIKRTDNFEPTENEDVRYSIAEDPAIEDLDQHNATVEDEDGNEIAHFQEDGSVMFSISSYDEEGRDIYKKYLDKMVNDGELSQKEADDMLNELETIYRISKQFADKTDENGDPIFAPFSAWSYADVVTDAKGKPVFSAIKKNSEYKMNIDFSTICKKRRTLDAVFREMINRGMFEKLDLNKDESAAMVVNINDLIRQHKFEAACALCFVEARRYRQQQTATTFRDMWNDLVESMYTDKSKIAYFNFGEDSTVEDVADGIHTMSDEDLDMSHLEEIANAKKNGKPVQTAEAKAARLILKDPSQRKLMRVGDMMASTGFENMQIQNPELMKIYNSKKGTGGAKSSFGDVQYLNEMLKSKTFDRMKAYAVSGVRIQSFSDYVPRMVFDYVQVIADLAAKKLPAHAYTKEVLFARQFGLTGAKINLSLVPDVVPDGKAPGLDSEGNYIWNEEGTFPYDEAMKLQEAEGYKENCGTIAVGISDAQIMKMLADPTIQMVIPYHKSSLNPIVAAMTNVNRFKNYEDVQNTKDENGKSLSGKKDFNWDNKLFRLTHDTKGNLKPKNKWGNVQDLVKEYVEWCEKKGYTPKFADFLYARKNNDINGEILKDTDGNKIINPGYYKLLEDFALLDNDGNFKPQGDVQMRFPTESDVFGSMKDLIEQGLSEDTALEAKRSAEIGGIVDEIEGLFEEGRLTEQSATSEKLAARMSISEDLDEPYMSAVESGNMEEAQKYVDEAAKRAMPNTKLHGLWYHGTDNDFNIFDFRQGGTHGTAEGFGIYLSDSQEVTSHYGNRQIKGYVNMQRPASAFEQTLTHAELKKLVTATVEHEAQKMADEYDDDIEAAKKDTWISNYVNTSQISLSKAISETAKVVTQWNGNDMDIVQEIINGMGIRSYDEAVVFNDILTETTGIDGYMTKWGDEDDMSNPNNPTIAVAFRSNQIKSADPVTYAEDGSVIPLSERFDPNNNDIRYSLSTTDADGNILTDGQMEYFKNSQARDADGRLQAVYHTTNNGGFTIFDPKYSDDKRSLFFASNWDVSQTYGRNAYRPIEYLTDEEQLLVDEFPFIAGNDMDSKQKRQSGYYTCYLNLENPLEVDAKGANWNRIPYGTVKPNPIREQTLAKMESEAEAIVDHISAEWDDYDDNFEGGNYRTLNFELTGKIRMEDGSFDDWSVVESFTIDEKKFAELASSDYDTPGSILSEELGEYWTETLKLSYDYFEDVMNYANDMDGSVDYDSQTANQEAAPDYITADGYKIDYAELFDELNEEAGENYSPYEGVKAQTYRTRELAEMAEANGNDGVIIRNCRDIGGTSHLKRGASSLSDIFIAFSSNQVKDTRNENPSENPDIRYSFTPDEDAELMNRLAEANADNWSNEELLYYERLAEADQAEQNKFFDKIRKWSEDRINVFYDSLVSAEEMPSEDPELEEGRIRMAKSKSDFYNSLSAKWNEKWLTNGEVLDVNSVRGKIKSLIKAQMQNSDTDKQYKTDVLNRTLVDVRTAYLMSKRGRIEVADEILWRSALNMIENVEFIHDETFRDYKGLRDYLRTTKIAVGEELYADIEINEFRRRNFNKIHVVSGATNVVTIYQELCELYPEWFSEEDDMNPADQLLRMEHVLDAIQPYKQAYTSEEAAELAFDIASDLADIIYGYGKPIESVADHYKNKYDQKTKALKVRQQEAMREAQAEISELKKELAKSERTVEREQQRTERAEKKLAKEKQKRKDEKAKKRDAKERARYTGQIDKNYRWLTDRLLNPTQDKNIPEGFRKDLARLLCMFDFQTEKSRELEQKYGIPSQKTFKMWDLHSKLCGVMNEDNGGVFQTNEYLDFLSENIAKRIDGKSLDSLETADLLSVDELLKVIVKQFRNYDSVRVGEKREKVADLGGSVISESDDKVARDGQAKERGGLIGALDKVVNMAELTPIYFFQRLGTMYTMYKEVRKGFDNYVRNEKKMLDQISSICSEYYTKKSNRPGSELQAWRDSRSAQTIQLTHGTVTMTAAQMMSFYCLSKRMQARGHIIQDGIVVTPIQEFSKVAKAMADAKGRTTQVDSVPVTLNDIDTIISKLTPDQIKIADKLQAMMSNEIAEMGNEASMSMYGIRMFKEKDYFPIKVSSRVTAKNMEQVDVTETIKNFGFTKPVKQNASNVIEVDDIFKIVADHCNNMNLYASYGETIGDFWKVFNYKQYNEDGSPSRTVQQALAKAYGDNCLKYIKNFIKDINGNVAGKRSGGLEEALNGILGRAKRAAVFANLRVALQQPTAIVRAFAVLNPKYIASIRVGKKTMQEMLEHCPIAQWKAWGFYDTFMGRDIEDVMMNNWSMSDVAMSGLYGYLDNKTWAAIWSMCKAEIKDTRKDLQEGTQEFWNAVNERASYVFDATQVVDSPFHRSDAMRSKDIMVKSLTSFQSEPTLTFNVVRGGIVNALESVRNGNKAEASAILGRTLTVFVAQAVVVSATAAVWDAVRRKGADDDEDPTWAELWLDNFFNNLKDNVNLLNNIYLAKEIMPYIDKALFGGYGGNNNLLFQGLETLSTGVQQTMKKIEKGDEYDKSWYDVLTNLFGGIGYLGGVPIKTLMRDFKGITSWFGLDVFAADEMESDADKIAKSGEMISESHWYDYNRNPLNIKDGSLADNVLNHFGINRTEREKEAALQAEQRKRIEKKTGEISKKVSGLSGEEKGKKAWSAVTSFAKTEYGDQGINDLIAAGDFKTINQYREMYESAVGDTEYFDKRIFDLSKKQMKKTIIYNPTYEQAEAQNNLKNYLLDHGMTESELSDMAYKSYTRKELQVAMRLNDQDAVVEELIPLIMAGMTYDDFEKAYKNRNRVNIKEYKESGGKYADRFKSTGVYNWPINGQITSGFGHRSSPGGIGSTNHQGLDIAGSMGDPVGASDGGTVVYAGWYGGAGKTVMIQHDDGTVTQYSHLSWWDVHKGDIVGQGQTIGNVGSTGNSTGPHLHFAVMVNDSYVDPTQYLNKR